MHDAGLRRLVVCKWFTSRVPCQSAEQHQTLLPNSASRHCRCRHCRRRHRRRMHRDDAAGWGRASCTQAGHHQDQAQTAKLQCKSCTRLCLRHAPIHYVSKPSTPQIASSAIASTSSRAYPGGTLAMHVRTTLPVGRGAPLAASLLLIFTISICTVQKGCDVAGVRQAGPKQTAGQEAAPGASAAKPTSCQGSAHLAQPAVACMAACGYLHTTSLCHLPYQLPWLGLACHALLHEHMWGWQGGWARGACSSACLGAASHQA